MFLNIPFKLEKKEIDELFWIDIHVQHIKKKILSIILSENGPIEKIWLYDKRYV